MKVHPQLYPAFAPATALSAGFDLRWPEREIVIRTGDRILQLLLVPILRPAVTLVSEIDGSGRGGLGSTGVA